MPRFDKSKITCVKGKPAVSIGAWSNSGKTTFLEQVVPLLRDKGITVGVIKHHSHTSPIDAVGKDSYRYAQAGAYPVIVSSPDEYGVFRRNPGNEAKLVDLCAEIADECDLILTEGYKYEALTKVEFSRVGHKPEPIFPDDEIIALITDNKERAQAFQENTGKPLFELDEFEAFADFLYELTQEFKE